MLTDVLELYSFRLVASVGIAGTVVGVFLHYIVFGPHRVETGAAKAKADVRRLSFWERLVHATALLSFCTLGVTGIVAAVGYGSRITGWLWVVHAFAAPVFCAGLAGVVIMWARDARFAPYDFKWLLYVGGYLGFGKNKDLKAGRFNAGQKAYLWIIGVLGLVIVCSGLVRLFPVLGEPWDAYAYYAHQYSTLLTVMAVIGHAYLGTLANPGTIQVALLGRVTREWARKHHPVWWQDLNKDNG